MNPDRTRWGDSRLDDLANELRALRDLPARLAELIVELRHVSEDTTACHKAVRDLGQEFKDYREEQEKLHEAHRLERKQDRRWMVGTVLTAAIFIVAALGLLLGHAG